MAELRPAVAVTECVLFLVEVKRLEIFAAHQLDGLAIELGIGIDLLLGILAAEAAAELVDQFEPFLEQCIVQVLGPRRVLQA